MKPLVGVLLLGVSLVGQFAARGAPSSAAFSGSTAKVNAWAPATKPFFADLVEPAGAIVIAALTKSLGNSPNRLVAYSASSGQRVWLSPLGFRGGINAIAADARYVVVGGAFRNVR